MLTPPGLGAPGFGVGGLRPCEPGAEVGRRPGVLRAHLPQRAWPLGQSQPGCPVPPVLLQLQQQRAGHQRLLRTAHASSPVSPLSCWPPVSPGPGRSQSVSGAASDSADISAPPAAARPGGHGSPRQPEEDARRGWRRQQGAPAVRAPRRAAGRRRAVAGSGRLPVARELAAAIPAAMCAAGRRSVCGASRRRYGPPRSGAARRPKRAANGCGNRANGAASRTYGRTAAHRQRRCHQRAAHRRCSTRGCPAQDRVAGPLCCRPARVGSNRPGR